MKYSKLTPEKALTIKAGIELDVFIFEFIFDQVIGEEEWKSVATGHQIPSFSKRAEASKMLMIRMFAQESFQMIVERGTRLYTDAVDRGFILPGNEIAVWTVMGQGLTSHGRTFEEAIAKLAILFKMKGYLG